MLPQNQGNQQNCHLKHIFFQFQYHKYSIHYLDKTTFKTTGYAYICNLAFKITRKTLQCLEKLYPKVHTIIDCTEIYTETPSSLDSHCLLWSDYKHHTTIKILISIIPNGVIHFLGFPLHMVGELQMLLILLGSGFLDLLEPLMADI